jgi:shikimate dehydrogenase
VVGVIGDPVRHSLSPALHNAAFAALGLDWAYLAFPVPAGKVPEAIAGVRALGIDGLSVTMPHNAAVVAHVDQLSPTAALLGAANTVIRRGAQLAAESTDGDGFLAALRLDEGWEPAGRRCLLLGTGGAARAVALALGQAGAAEVAVVGRRPEMAEMTAGLAGPAGCTAEPEAAEQADLIVNATPVGMTSVVGMRGEALAAEIPFGLDVGLLRRGQVVVDLIYSPAATPLLVGARHQGATTANGLGMLIHQAALQFRLWTGEDPPMEVMSAAALSALGH